LLNITTKMTSIVTYQGNLRTSCVHLDSKSEILTDAPKDNHGKGEIFSPTDLVATALASCMITVMAIKAASKHIPFENVMAEVKKNMSSSPRSISKIEVTFTIKDSWLPGDKSLLEQTALTCPVAKSLNDALAVEVHFNYAEE
jgi:putative redox protein